MSNGYRGYRTASVVQDGRHTDYLFAPRGEVIKGTVRVEIATTNIKPSSPQRHPKVHAALLLASHFHPYHAVSVRLEKAHYWQERCRGREWFEFRVV